MHKYENRRLSALTVVVAVQAAFLVMRLAGVTDWGWVAVLSPLLATLAVSAVGMVVAVVSSAFRK